MMFFFIVLSIFYLLLMLFSFELTIPEAVLYYFPDACVKFLENQAKGLDLPIKIYHVVPKKPIVILTWVGTEPTLPTILLNSHMDVVPVFEDKWTHKPFSADIDEQNNIYARGTQDMKCVGIQYLEAVRRLKQQGVSLKRTLHLSFVPGKCLSDVCTNLMNLTSWI
jgi:aminoacylase